MIPTLARRVARPQRNVRQRVRAGRRRVGHAVQDAGLAEPGVEAAVASKPGRVHVPGAGVVLDGAAAPRRGEARRVAVRRRGGRVVEAEAAAGAVVNPSLRFLSFF